MENENVTQIATLTNTVAAEHEAHVAALSSERAAEVELLRAVIEAVRPALKAIASRIKVSNRWGSNGVHPGEETEYCELCGLYLNPYTAIGPWRERRGSTRGSYTGTDRFLLTDGSILELQYDGHWSQWQGETSGWTSTQTVVPLEKLSSKQVHDAIRAIGEALQKQADGNKTKRTAASIARATKITAMTALLK